MLPLLQDVGHGVQTTCPFPEWSTDLFVVQRECNRMLDGVGPALHPWHMLGQPGAAAAAWWFEGLSKVKIKKNYYFGKY